MADDVYRMTTRRFAVVVLFLALCAQACRPIATPDLSGTWKLNPAKSKTTKGTELRARILVIQVSGTTIRMGIDTPQTPFVVDGNEHFVREVEAGGMIYTKAYWKKSALFTEVIGRVKAPSMPSIDGSEVYHATDRWTLSSDGNQLTDEGIGSHVVGTIVYDRQ
jgi:hypothetical protein